MTAPAFNRQQLLDTIFERASCERSFRDDLLCSPRDTIQREFGLQVPADFTIKFVEKEPGIDSLVVLPDFRGDQELSDDALDAVCGGTGGGEGGGGTGEEDSWA